MEQGSPARRCVGTFGELFTKEVWLSRTCREAKIGPTRAGAEKRSFDDCLGKGRAARRRAADCLADTRNERRCGGRSSTDPEEVPATDLAHGPRFGLGGASSFQISESSHGASLIGTQIELREREKHLKLPKAKGHLGPAGSDQVVSIRAARVAPQRVGWLCGSVRHQPHPTRQSHRVRLDRLFATDRCASDESFPIAAGSRPFGGA